MSDLPRRLALAAALALALATPLPAAAQVANGPDYAFGSATAEAAVSAISVASMALSFLPQQRSGWGPSGARARNDTFGAISDFSGSVIGASWQATGAYALEAAYYSNHDVRDPELRALRSSLIDLQSITLSVGITMALKRLTGRCRPRAWHKGRCGPDPEHSSFPSGHTALVAAVAGSHLLLAARSTADATPRYLAFGFAESATVATAALRVLAGAHSWEDVLAGWVIGHATGALLSLAHPMVDLESTGTVVSASSAAGLSYSGNF